MPTSRVTDPSNVSQLQLRTHQAAQAAHATGTSGQKHSSDDAGFVDDDIEEGNSASTPSQVASKTSSECFDLIQSCMCV